MDPILLLANVGANIPDGAMIAGICALTFLGGVALFNTGQKREQLKRELMQLSEVSSSEGLNLTGGIMEDIVVEDYSGLVVHTRNLLGRLRNPDSRREIVLPFLKTQLIKWAKGEGGRDPKQLKAFIEEALGGTITFTPTPPKNATP